MLSFASASDAIKRKQDKEREAAGLPPLQRLGAAAARGRGNANQRGTASNRGGASISTQRNNTGTVTYGPRAFGGATATDKNAWVHLIQYLKKSELLPVVVFTFSKKRCEDNASSLSGQDLVTASQKSEIHVTIEKALTRLKGSDSYLRRSGPSSYVWS